MSEKSDADILAESREYIEKNGWWRGSLVGPNHRQVCGMGAIIMSQGWENNRDASAVPNGCQHRYQKRLDDLLNKVTRAVGVEDYGFIHWNDERATKQGVLDAFAKAEKIERAGFDPDKGVLP